VSILNHWNRANVLICTPVSIEPPSYSAGLARLGNDTEVIIAPRTRKPPPASAPQEVPLAKGPTPAQKDEEKDQEIQLKKLSKRRFRLFGEDDFAIPSAPSGVLSESIIVVSPTAFVSLIRGFPTTLAAIQLAPFNASSQVSQTPPSDEEEEAVPPTLVVRLQEDPKVEGPFAMLKLGMGSESWMKEIGAKDSDDIRGEWVRFVNQDASETV
jgi:hypothetical protein